MAQQKRSEILAEAKIWAGRKAEALALNKAFDFVTKDMSRRYSLLPTEDTGSLVADQNYIALPGDYRDPRLVNVGGRRYERYSNFKVGDDWLSLLNDSSDFYHYDQTEHGPPTLYTIEQAPSIGKILFYPKTETDTPAYEFHYFKFHEKAWEAWAGIAAEVDISFDAATKTIAQVAAGFDVGACRAGRELIVTGSAFNNGTFTIVSATAAAVVVAEAIVDEAAGETVTIAVESEDDYFHLYGEEWDEVVVHGVAWRAAKHVKEWKIAQAELEIYEEMLGDMAEVVTKKPRPGRVAYYHF